MGKCSVSTAQTSARPPLAESLVQNLSRWTVSCPLLPFPPSLPQSVLSPPVLLCSSRCHAPPPHTSLSSLTTYWKMRRIILSFSCTFLLHPSSCPRSFCSSISLSLLPFHSSLCWFSLLILPPASFFMWFQLHFATPQHSIVWKCFTCT